MTETVVITEKVINPNQLATELQGSPVSVTVYGLNESTEIVVLDGSLTEAQLQSAIDAHVAIDETGNRTTIEGQALNALQANRDFLALATPTNAQVLAQVKALTRQNNGIIRLALNKLDGIN